MATGRLGSVADLYTLRTDELEALPRVGAKSAQNLMAALEESRHRPLGRLLFALGLRHVGERAAQTLAAHFGSIGRLARADEAALALVDDVGPATIESLRHWFGDEANVRLLDALAAGGVHAADLAYEPPSAAPPAAAEGPLSGREVVFTGRLGRPRAEAQEAAVRAGATVADRVTRRTGLLVVGQDAGSKRAKAEAMGVEVWDEDTFWRAIRPDQAGIV